MESRFMTDETADSFEDIIDISRRKSMEEVLRKTEEKYRELVRCAPVGIFEVDFKTRRFLSVNDVMCEMTGYTREELLQKGPLELLSAESRELFLQRTREWLSGRTPETTVDYMLTGKDGKEIFISLNVSFTTDATGYPLGSMGIVHNITERRKAEEALRISEEKYRTLFNAMQEGFFIIDVIFDQAGKACDWRFIETNAAFEKQSGLKGADGKLISELLPEVEKYWFDFFGRVAKTGDPARYARQMKALDRWFEVCAFRLDGGGKVAVVLRDVTRHKLREKRIRDLIAQLKQYDRNKNEFLNMLSHELRNPLASISAGIDLLSLTKDRNKSDRAKEVIKNQLGHLCRLVDDLLDLTRITNNKMRLRIEYVDLNALVKKTARDYAWQFERKGIAFVADAENRPLEIDADPVRIAQMTGNLLNNALKFTKSGGTVWLSVYGGETLAAICVKDNGMGIEPVFLPRIFEPFFQADDPLVQSAGGLGLGLHIAKTIAELHGGSITASSGGAGKGAEFIIRLPLKKSAGKGAGIAPENGGRRKPLRILLIEGNRDFSEMLCAMLKMLGHRPVKAYTGPDGIKKALALRPDAIFCDIGLPGMDGFEVARALRSGGKTKGIPLFALTGYAREDNLKRAVRAGFDRHIIKPVDVETLKDVLKLI